MWLCVCKGEDGKEIVPSPWRARIDPPGVHIPPFSSCFPLFHVMLWRKKGRGWIRKARWSWEIRSFLSIPAGLGAVDGVLHSEPSLRHFLPFSGRFSCPSTRKHSAEGSIGRIRWFESKKPVLSRLYGYPRGTKPIEPATVHTPLLFFLLLALY